MNTDTKEIYSELYQILNLLGSDYINKLPKSLYNMVEEKRNLDYMPQYVEDQPLSEQNIKKETIAMLALLHLNYWCESEAEKQELRKMLKDNEDKYQEELRIKYNPDNIFKNEQQIVPKKETSIAVVEDLKWYQKIFDTIRNLLHHFF